MRKSLRKLFGLDSRTGTDIVNDVLEQFTTMTTDLAMGIDLLDENIDSNQRIVESLKAENTKLGSKKVQAIAFRKGLENLLNGAA